MNSIPFHSSRPIAKRRFKTLRSTHERTRKTHWQGSKDTITPALLAHSFGDGLQPVMLSFYAAPEVAIIILFDSSLPLDHEDIAVRCATHSAITSFREAANEIYDLAEAQWNLPPGITDYRLAEIREELELDPQDEDSEEPQIWDHVIQGGGTWCHV